MPRHFCLSSALLLCGLAFPAAFADQGKISSKSLQVPLQTVISGTLATPAETDRFTFEAALGQRLYFDSLDNANTQVVVQLTGPDGKSVASLGGGRDFGPFYATQAGTHTIELQAPDLAPANYSFRVLDTDAMPTLGFGAVTSGTLSPATRSDLYRFSGIAGQRINLTQMNADPAPQGSWSLLTPGGWTLAANSLGADLGDLFLPETGTYLLVLAGHSSGPDSAPYSVKGSLLSSPSGAASGFGQSHSGSVSQDEEIVFTYTAPAGTWVLLDSNATENPAAPIDFLSPSGERLFQAGYSDSGPLQLTASGTFKAVVRNPDSATPLNYSFRILDLSHDALPLAFGTVYRQTLDPGNSVAVYAFDGSPGQTLRYDGLKPLQSLVNFDLLPPAASLFASGSADQDSQPIRLTAPGRYYLVLAGHSVEPIPFRFRLLDAAAPPGQPIALNTVQNRSLNPFETDLLTFSIQGGQRILIDGLAPAPAVGITVYDSAASYLGSLDPNGFFELKNPPAGQYFLRVSNNGGEPAPYSFNIITAESSSLPLTLGAIVNGSLTESGQEGHFTFAGKVGQRLYYDDLAESSVPLRLVAPSGALLLNQTTGRDAAPVTLLENGTYDLVVGGNSETTGAFSFRLIDLAQNPASDLPLDTTFNGNPDTFKTKVFRLHVTSGQKLFFDGLDPAAVGIWELFSPANQFLAFSQLSDNFIYTPTETGTFLFAVSSSSGSFSIRVIAAKSSTAPLALGATMRVSLTEAGEERRFTFAGTAGQRLYYDSLKSDLGNIAARLFDPNGELELSGDAGSDLGPFTLRQSGTYTLVIGGYSDLVSDFRFRLLDGANDVTQIALDTDVGAVLKPVPASQLSLTGSYISGSLGSRPDPDDWRASQTIAGTREDASIDFEGNSWGTLASVGLSEDANGSSSDWDNYSAQWDGTVTITQAGTSLYLKSIGSSRFWVDANKDGVFSESELADNNWGHSPGVETISDASPHLPPGTYPIRIQYEAGFGPNSAILLADGAASLEPFESAVVKVFVPAGQRLVFNTLVPDVFGLSWNLTSPEDWTYEGGFSSFSEIPASKVAGNWFFAIQNRTAKALSYGYRLTTPTDLREPLAFNQVYSGALSEPDERHLFTFTASAGQRLFYDCLQAASGVVAIRLLDPAGNTIWDIGNADQDIGPFTLAEQGTYTLVQDNNSNAAASCPFRLLDVNNAPALQEGAPVAGTLIPSTQVAVYLVHQPLNMKVAFQPEPTAGASWHLYDPSDALVAEGGMTGNLNATIAKPGSYVLILNGLDTAPIAYNFTMIPGNHAPRISPIFDLTLIAEQPFSFQAVATDPEQPNDRLTWTFDGDVPQGLALNPFTGVLSWTPAESQGPAAYPVTLRVADDGVPSLSSSISFNLIVQEAAVARAPRIQSFRLAADGKPTLTVTAVTGARYALEFKNDLREATWSRIGGEIIAVGSSLTLVDAAPGASARYYRAALLD